MSKDIEPKADGHIANEVSPEAPTQESRRDFLLAGGLVSTAAVAGPALLFSQGAHADTSGTSEDSSGSNAKPMEPVNDDVFIIDAVVHAYNLSPDNRKNRWGESLANLVYGVHATWNPPELTMPPSAFVSDIPMEAVARTLFLESRVDMAVHHNLRLDSWFKDGLISEDKNIEATEKWSDRFITYVGVDPLQSPDEFISDMRRQKELLPNAVGIKLYPHGVDPYRRWRADDPEIFRLFEEAQKLGFKNIGIHKALPNGNVPMDPYRVDDMDLAADTFPDLNFEIIHAGMAFLEETCWAMARFPNVYANLEVTSSLLYKAPGWFEDILAFMMFWAGPQKIIFSTGAVLAHPQALIEKFWNFEFSDATLNKYGLNQITKEDKTLILGANYARLIDLNIDEAKSKVRNDTFAKEVQSQGLAKPFSHWKKMAGVDQ